MIATNEEILKKFAEFDLEIQSTQNPYLENSYLNFSKFYITNFDYPTNEIIDKITILDFNIYCIDSITQEKVILPSQDYSLFSVKNKILIAFHNYATFTPKTYIYAEYKTKKILIQKNTFEEIERFIFLGRDHSWGNFVFMNSRIVEEKDSPINRCDLNDYGPIFWNDDGSSNDKGFNDSFNKKIDLSMVAEAFIIFSSPNNGHILYIRFKNGPELTMSDREELRYQYHNEAIVPTTAITFYELIKLIIEWGSVVDSPWNNEQEIAIKAKKFISSLDIPKDIIDYINENQANMQVYRYLTGDTEARQRPPLYDIATMPQNVYDWLKTQFCYNKFENLLMSHPYFYGNN